MKRFMLSFILVILSAFVADAQTVRRDWATPNPETKSTESVQAPSPSPTPVTSPSVSPTPATSSKPEWATKEELQQLSREVATAFNDLRTPEWATKEELQQLRKEVAAAFNDLRREQEKALTKEPESSWLSLIVSLLLGIAVTGFVISIFLSLRRRRKMPPPHIHDATAVSMITFMLLASASFAEEKKCVIKGIMTGETIVVGEKPAEIRINARGCADVQSIRSIQGVNFTDVKGTPTRVIAKVEAEQGVATGPAGFQVTLEDGSTIESPDSAPITLLDAGTAQVRKELVQRTDSLQKNFTSKVNAVDSRVKTLESSMLTEDRVRALITEGMDQVKSELTQKMKAEGAEKDQVLETKRMELLALLSALSEGQVRLANTEVKKGGILGIGGKKPLSTEEAARAAWVRTQIAKLLQPQ